MPDVNLRVDKDRTTLRGKVEETLRVAIINGTFKPGQRLVERELCELLDVGRTSVREAIRQLEAEGLLVSVPHRGPTVSRITAEEAEQLYSLRGLLEGYAGRQCALRATPQFKDEFDAAVEAFAEVAHENGSAEMIRAKAAIYDLLMEGSGNSFVRQTITSMHNRINLLRFTSMAQPGRPARSVAEIREIAGAIRAGDPERAEAACRRHIEEAARIAVGCMRNPKK
jgi:DNA-binding GntR family transcriptional regulator